METFIVALVFVALCVPIGFGIARSTEVFVLRFERGRLRYARGRMPKALLGEIEAVLGRVKLSGRVVVRRWRGAVTVTTDGAIDVGTAQQLRNVIGIVPLQRLLSAAPLKHRN